MFDAIAKMTGGVGINRPPLNQPNQWLKGQGQQGIDYTTLGLGDQQFAPGTSMGLAGQQLSPDFLKQIGYTGNSNVTGYQTPNSDGTQVDPAFSKYLQDNGISLGYDTTGEKGVPNGGQTLLNAYDRNNNQIGQSVGSADDGGDGFALGGLLLAGGFGAATLAGAGAAGAAGGSGAAEGGAGAAADAGGLAGTGLPAYSANPYGYGSALTASSEAGIPAGSLEAAGGAGGAGAAGGAAGGMSSADLAALYGTEGYGGAAGGAAAGGGLLSQLGGAASDASSWMKANPGTTNLLGGLANSAIGAYTANNALNQQKNYTGQANALLAPYVATGQQALGKLNGLMQSPSSITSDPGYQFGLGQGQQALDHSAAAKGGLYSGATLKALDRYGQDYAGTKLNDAYSRYGNVAAMGSNAATGSANNLTGLGNAAAGTSYYTGNAAQNGVNNTLGQFNFSNNLANGGNMQIPYQGQNPYGQSSYQQPKG